MSAITASDIDTLRAYRERAESAFAQACRELVDDPDNVRLLSAVKAAARTYRNARTMYASALQEIGGQMRTAVQVPADQVALAVAMAEGAP